AGERVVDRLARHVLIEVPVARATVQLVHAIRTRALELVAQELAEEMVVAVPIAARVQRHGEEPGALQLLEARGRPRPTRNRVTQATREAIEDRGIEQERLHILGLAVEDLEG